jgi:hypothetical protein
LQVRRLGLKCALSAKANEGRLILVNSLTPSTPKTKFMAQQLQALLDNQAANSLASASEFMRSAEEAGCSSLVSRQRMLAEAQAGGTEQRREGPEWTQQQHEEQQQREQQQLEAGSQLDRGLGSLLQQLQQPEAAQEQTLPQGQQQQQQQETPGSGQERKAAGLVASRLSAVLIDSAKDGDDGGSLMRRAVNNLPGELWHVVESIDCSTDCSTGCSTTCSAVCITDCGDVCMGYRTRWRHACLLSG